MDFDPRTRGSDRRGWPERLPRHAEIEALVPADAAYARLLKRGRKRTVLRTTFVAIASSAVMTYFMLWLGGFTVGDSAQVARFRGWALLTSVIIPAVVSPLLILWLLRILNHVEAVLAQVNRMAASDALTGLMNRRSFMQAAQQQIRDCAAAGRPLGLILLDIDRFKLINDTWGHSAGDAALVRLADHLRESCESHALAARLGGEEFVLLLADAGIERVAQVAEALRRRVEGDEAGNPPAAVASMRISAGVASSSEGMTSLSQLLRRADARLYIAKRQGRNRVEAHALPDPDAGAH
ncbi:GGDEF domain-containing protein [Luteimonas sp. e5]